MNNERRLLVVAAVGAVVVCASITAGVVLGGDIPEVLWVLLVPIGMFTAGIVAIGAFGTVVWRRVTEPVHRRAR